MQRPSFDPSTITRPIQLSAAWFAALLILEGTWLTGAIKIGHPGWAAGALVAVALAMPFAAGLVVFLLQTHFREEQMTDPYYSEAIKRREEQFRDFTPVAVSAPTTIAPEDAAAKGGGDDRSEEGCGHLLELPAGP
jgi:hypothetical protein